MRSAIIFLVSGLLVGLLGIQAFAQKNEKTVQSILESYVEDFRSDAAAATARVFGIRITGKDRGEWRVKVAGSKGSGKWDVKLEKGMPKQPTFVYSLSSSTLREIDGGRINGLTVQGKAFSSDITPMAINWMPGSEKFDVNPFSFHFWTRGFPERVQFRSGGTRVVHNAPLGVFYYQKGFRSAWALLQKGQAANNGPGNPLIAPFPTMVIITAGSAKGIVKGKTLTVNAGEMIFIPPMTPHEWWNENEEPTEAILLFFGKSA